MPALGEYLGALLSEVANARLQADLESARIAQLYASHPILQHLPVPRFRLPNVVLDLPVAVEKTDRPPGTVPPATELPAVRRNIDSLIELELIRQNISPSPSARTKLTNRLNELFDRLKLLDSISASDALKATDDAVAATVEAMKAAI